LDAIVEDVYKYFVNRYVEGEILNCVWDDNIAYSIYFIVWYNGLYKLTFFYSYTAKVLGIAGKDEIAAAKTTATIDESVPNGINEESDKKEEEQALEYYKVQLIDENSDGIDDFIKIVPNHKLK
jgi:bromodomain adjacent to zinc finger domain protein 1A